MREDTWRIIYILCTSVVIGLLSGQVLICLVAGLSLYLVWQYRALQQLLLWIRKRKDFLPPDLPGVIDEIVREIDFLRMHHRQRKKKLSRYLKRFKTSTQALPDAVIVLGEHGVIEWANSKAEDYLGICWPQDAGQRIANLVRHPDLFHFLAANHTLTQDSGLQLESPQNSVLSLEIRLSPYGKHQQLMVARDVTRITRINQMRRDFIANASHELRTPLTVISGYLETMEDDANISTEVLLAQVRQMRLQTVRMQRLIEDLLKLAALETALKDEEMEAVQVPDIIATVYQEAEAISGILGHIFSLESDPALWLLGNQNELYSAFSNLVINAVQYTPEHGVISIRWYEDKQGAHFEVNDSGMGILPEHLPRLTERFYRVDQGRSRDKGGTGLGLAIVKHVLERHSAALEIASEAGKGSTFRCNFPVAMIVHNMDDPGTILSA